MLTWTLRLRVKDGDEVEYLEDLRHERAVAQFGQELNLALGDGLGELGDELELVVSVCGGGCEALELQHRTKVVQQDGLPRHADVGPDALGHN